MDIYHITIGPVLGYKMQVGFQNVCITLIILMSFFGDSKKIILNMKQELVLIRSISNMDSDTSSDATENP